MKTIKNILNKSTFRCCILIVLVCSFNISNASTVTSVQSGNWDDPATWDCACEPDKKDNVIISSGDIVTLTDDIKINNITIESTAVLDVSTSNFEIKIKGSWINHGTFMQRDGEVIFKKKHAHSIGGSQATSFHNLTMKSTTGVTLAVPITIDNTLTLTKGNLNTDPSNYVTLSIEATTSGASDKSYIEGPIKIETDTIEKIVFDTGKNGKHKKIVVEVNSTDTTALIAEYFNVAYSETSVGPGIDHLSAPEYWQLSRDAGSADLSVTLYWEEPGINAPMHNLADARVVRFDNTQWVDAGNAATTWNPASIMSASLNVCGYFTFGCSTACGHDNGGQSKMGNTDGSYPSPDDEFVSDSKNEFSDLIAGENPLAPTYSIEVSPNPSRSDKLCVAIIGEKSQEVLIVVVDLLGREYYSKVCILDNGKYSLAIDPSNKLARGVYMIIATSENSLYRKKVVIQ